MKNMVKVIVVGDKDGEHFTYVGSIDGNGSYYRLYNDGYEGTSYNVVKSFLNFLGITIAPVFKDKLETPLPYVNWQDYI